MVGDLFGKDNSPPPAPDYTGAAVATAAGNADAARIGAKANRVSQYTPYGNLIYTPGVNGDQDQWRADVNLSPSGQQLLDLQNRTSVGLGNLTGAGLERVNQGFSQPFDYSSVGKIQDDAYKAYTGRLDDRFGREQESMETKLINQGLRPGSEAWANAQKDFSYGKNDAYNQAQISAINTMPQTFQLAQALRNQPLNELNALRTGSQVTNPQFQQVAQQQTTTGPNYMGATQAQGQYDQNIYNQGIAQQNAMMDGLFKLGSAAFGAPVGTFSDRRLKSNVERIGTHPLGIGIYEYDIFDRRERGVMADEVLTVLPEAVSVHPSGYMQVDYTRL